MPALPAKHYAAELQRQLLSLLGHEQIAARPDCGGKTGVIRFCATGGFAIPLAAGHGSSVAASNYGRVPNDIDAILDGACEFRWPRLDAEGTATRLNSALARRRFEHDVKEYPNAGHSFLDDPKGLIGVLGTVLGSSYEDKDAANAGGRIRAFFSRHLAE